MDETIRESLRYIERHLRAGITLADLAGEAGYSPWHFSRLFAGATGQSVAQYMLRRRLDHALAEMAAGASAVDAALSYGFDTYSGFYRAFVKLYGCSPRKYLRIHGGHDLMRMEEPMKHFTKKELRQALARWGMEDREIGDVPVMYDGRPDGSAWRVGDEHCLRTGDRARLLRDLQVTGALAAEGIAAEAPVPTLDGQAFADGEDVFLLSRVMPGEALRVSDCYGDQGTARAYGEGIARLHAALKRVSIPCDRGDLLGSVTGWALPAARRLDEQWAMGLGEAFFAGWQERFAGLYPKLPRQPIHRNLCPSYVLMRGGQVAGFTRFDMIEEEARLFDLCYAATAILSETADEACYPAWLGVLEGMLRGYDALSPLTREEKAAVHDMLCAIQMICVAFFDGQEAYREVARRNRAMLRFIAAQRGAIEGMFHR